MTFSSWPSARARAALVREVAGGDAHEAFGEEVHQGWTFGHAGQSRVVAHHHDVVAAEMGEKLRLRVRAGGAEDADGGRDDFSVAARLGPFRFAHEDLRLPVGRNNGRCCYVNRLNVGGGARFVAMPGRLCSGFISKTAASACKTVSDSGSKQKLIRIPNWLQSSAAIHPESDRKRRS